MHEVIEQFLAGVVRERGLSPNTIAAYRNDLEQFASYLRQQHHLADWHTLRSEHLEAFLRYLRERQYADTTTARKLAAIKAFCQHLVRSGMLESNPTDGLPTPRVGRFTPRALPVDAVRSLIAAASGDRSPEGLRDRAMLLTLATTGLRVSELTALDVPDIDLARRELVVRRANGRERRVPLSEEAAQALREYLEKARPLFAPAPGEQAAFLNHRGTRLTRQGFWLILKGYAQAAGIPDVTPHTLRHTFAVQALANGWELRDVQRVLGHVSPATTQIYRQLVQGFVQPDGHRGSEAEYFHPVAPERGAAEPRQIDA